MSIKIMNDVWEFFPDGGSKMLVMLKLADWADDGGGRIYPSIRMVALRTRISTAQARRHIHTLIDEGWLSVVGNEFGGAPGTTRHYRINVGKLVQIEIEMATGGTGARGRTDASPSKDSYPQTACTHARACTDARAGTHAPDGLHPCKGRACTHASLSVNYQSLSIKNREKLFCTAKQNLEGKNLLLTDQDQNLKGNNLQNQLPQCKNPSYEETADWIYKKILLMNSSHKRPNFKLWSEEIKKIRVLEKKNDQQIRKLFLFASKHEFWFKVILDPFRLRQNWAKLEFAMVHQK